MAHRCIHVGLFLQLVLQVWECLHWTYAHKAELGMVCAWLQQCRRHVAAVFVTVYTVIARSKLPALFFLNNFDMAGAARRRAGPVRVPFFEDSAGLDCTASVGGLGGFALVGGHFREVRKRYSSSTLHVSEKRKG